MKQRGFGLIVYAVLALGILGTLAGIGYKIREAGADSVRVEWQQANAAAQKKADEDRARQEAARAAQDKEASRRLANARKSNQELMRSLEAHIKAAGPVADCRLTDGLLGAWNAANKAGQGERTGTVPPASKPTAPAR